MIHLMQDKIVIAYRDHRLILNHGTAIVWHCQRNVNIVWFTEVVFR